MALLINRAFYMEIRGPALLRHDTRIWRGRFDFGNNLGGVW
jgi:hypothetical protein